MKSETWDATAGHRAEFFGQDVYRFDPTSATSHRWNPLDVIDRTSIDRFDQIARQAYLLMPENPTSSSNAEKFWIPKARLAFQAVALMLAEMEDQPLSLGYIWEIFARGDCQQWLAAQIEARRKAGRPFSRPVAIGISSFLGTDDVTLAANVAATVQTQLSVFFNPVAAAVTSASDFDLRDLRRRPMTIYVTIPPGAIPRYRELLALFFDQLVNLNTDLTSEQDPTVRYPLLVILDEFARLGRVVSLAQAAQFSRGYDLRIAYVMQDPAQLRELYGYNGAKDILSNVGAEVMFGTNDVDVATEFSRRLGNITVDVDSINRQRWLSGLNWSSQTQSTRPEARAILLPQEILQMPEGNMIVLRAGKPGGITQVLRWFEDPELSGLRLPPPYVPPLVIDPGADDEGLVIKGVGEMGKKPGSAPPLFRRASPIAGA